jgi:hypothetical protein
MRLATAALAGAAGDDIITAGTQTTTAITDATIRARNMREVRMFSVDVRSTTHSF